MTVLRREDVQSKVASWDKCPYRTVSSPILAIVPLITRRLRGPSLNRITMPHDVADRARIATSPLREPAGVRPTENPRARARSPRRSLVPAYVLPPTSGSADTDVAAPCRRSQSHAPAAPCDRRQGDR